MGTLIEQAENMTCKNDLFTATVVQIIAKASPLLQYLNFKNMPIFVDNKMIIEEVGIAGGNIDIALAAFQKDPDKCGHHELYLLRQLACNITNSLINGDKNIKYSFDGIEKLCQNNRRILNANDQPNVLSLDRLNDLLDYVENPTHLLMNETMQQHLIDFDQYISFGVDNFEQPITKYADIPILLSGKINELAYNDNYTYIVPPKEEDTKEILAFDEPDLNGASQCTSIYCLALEETGLIGLQNGEIVVRDFGELDAEPMYRKRIEWYICLVLLRANAIGGLKFILDGDVVE